MAGDPVESVDLLHLAAGIDWPTIDKMAHALGWPGRAECTAKRRTPKFRRVKWRNPYRNYYCGSPADPDWLRAAGAGLADQEPDHISGASRSGQCYWRVTPLGQAVLRLRLLAALEARRGGMAPLSEEVSDGQ